MARRERRAVGAWLVWRRWYGVVRGCNRHAGPHPTVSNLRGMNRDSTSYPEIPRHIPRTGRRGQPQRAQECAGVAL
eukprot:scaffold5_cov112-Isochrysis_galbana.AAC.3